MKYLFCFAFLVNTFLLSAQCLKICTWNLENLGKSKTDGILEYIAKTLKDFDVVAVQEVSTSPAGAQAVAKIIDALNRKGSKWDYKVSDPTIGKGTERYAFLWKTSRGKLLKSWLEASLAETIDREPFLGVFVSGKDTFLLGSFHAVPKGKNPDLETCQFYKIDEKYEKYHFLIMGDFNSPAKSMGFGSLLKRNVLNTFSSQKTTLKQKPSAAGEHLANEYDNIFYEVDEIILNDKGVIDFSKEFTDLMNARKVSDHLPVWGCYSVKKK
ncbi:MAG: endonuclease/exonuclease/phosphatase family protein [Bacteroidetes bacterium]|nr:endonuclease/exonuclease/phosphatase family protein [Bacteroidota bacterium]